MRLNKSLKFCVLAAILGCARPALAEGLPAARPELVGLSTARLGRIGEVLQKYVDEGRLGGAVALVARNGKVAYFQSFGKLDPTIGAAMPTDAIFRIASQSKAVTSVAVMILFEEGRLLLGDPVSKYIPEFKETTVAVPDTAKKGPGYKVVPAKRPITIRDLLTHTAGVSYGDGPAKDLYKAAGLFQGWFMADRPEPIGTYIKKLARLPFDAQPGEKWVYGYGTDILGYLVEVVSGMSLTDFIKERITDPLGMNDTHFFLPEEKAGRLAAVYGIGKDGKAGLAADPREYAYVKGPRTCAAGGAGLLSTAEDYARFLLMLQSGGEWGGIHILSPKSVELMTADHVGPQLYGTQGFGLGFWVTKELGRNADPGSVGAFGWGGAYHTTYWVDPAEKLVAVFMTQLMPADGSDAQGKFKALVYQAIVDSYERR